MSVVEAHRPVGRTEAEIAADAVWALFVIGLIPRTVENIQMAAHAAGLSLQALRDADHRHQFGYAKAPKPEPDRHLASVTKIDAPKQRKVHPGNPGPRPRRECPFCGEMVMTPGKPWSSHMARFHAEEWEAEIEAEMTEKYGPQCPDCGERIKITVTVERHCCRVK